MRKVLIGSALIAGLLAGPALAADIIPRPPPPPPPVPYRVVAPIISWTGFYIGGELGGRWANATWTTTCLGPGVAGNVCPGSAGDLPTRVAFNNPASFNSAGFRGGFYGGYNWQIGAGVIGIEGDWAWGRNSKTLAGIPGAENHTVAGSPGLDTSNVKETWDAGVRGRLGFLASPTVLLYGTGGASWTSLKASAFCGTAFPVGWCAQAQFIGTTSTISKTLTGWTAGGGLEWMAAPNWLLRGEYRYTSYGSMSGTFFPGGTAPVNGDAIAATIKLHTHTGLFGFAYKFGGGPIVAGY